MCGYSKNFFRRRFVLLACLFAAVFIQGCNISSSKPVLEVSFCGTAEEVPLSYLTTLIGTGSGNDETFGERRNVLIFFEEDDCGTCMEVKPVINEWVRKRGYSVFSYKSDYSSESVEERESFLRKLGSADGKNLSAARLLAFSGGKRVGAVSGNFDLESTEKIDSFVKRYFDISVSFQDGERRKNLSGLNELRSRVSGGEKFLLYLSRYSCPYCRNLCDPSDGNIINRLASGYSGNFYKLTSEKSLSELEEAGAFEHFAKSGTDGILWNGVSNLKKKAEYLEILVALGLVPPFPDDDISFFNAVDDYAHSQSEKFLESDRNVPSFVMSNIDCQKVGKDAALEAKIKILSDAYRKSGMNKDDGNPPHRASFLCYFAPSLSKMGSENYYESLKAWLSHE